MILFNAKFLESLLARFVFAADGEKEHEKTEDEEDDSPVEVDVDAERMLCVDRLVAEFSIDDKDDAEEAEDDAEWKSEIEVHDGLGIED